ncbi:hypothetical protein [Bradyrhizobium sp. CCBAU 51753]|uniref:hypothetical protein n=1 Tax=Bradyrhizobium sp. CCBAU 51753 TaxID=1325100 RepID=UPI00188A498E|nr:hypothetical protein [Bradyrhizobium sp. CCBAU 51753]
MSEAVGARFRLLLNARRRMECVSPKGKCDEASQQQKAATDRDQEMRERHLEHPNCEVSCGAICAAAWQSKMHFRN